MADFLAKQEENDVTSVILPRNVLEDDNTLYERKRDGWEQR